MHGRLAVGTAANGRAILATKSAGMYLWCVVVLVLRHGFHPWGRYVFPIADESVHPSLRRGRLRVLAGWDPFGGYYLLADSAADDALLRAFAARRGASSR